MTRLKIPRKCSYLFPFVFTLTSCYSYAPDEMQDLNAVILPAAELEVADAQKNTQASSDDLMKFIQSYAHSDIDMSPEDAQLFSNLPENPPLQSLEATAMGVGLVSKWYTLHRANTSQILERDLENPDTLAEQSRSPLSPSLEVLAANRQFALAEALKDNTFLQSYRFQKRLYFALQQSPEQSPEFKTAVLSALDDSVGDGSVFTRKKNGDLENAMSTDPIGIEENSSVSSQLEGDLSSKASVEVSPALPFGSDTFVSDEGVLDEAQALADQEQFLLAVNKLNTLGEESMLYAASQEKVREISNIAVRSLRRKAAQAFQSAKPVADLKTKAAYLSEAKGHLQSALDSFPLADQIDTVKSNLQIISRDLTQVKARLNEGGSLQVQ